MKLPPAPPRDVRIFGSVATEEDLIAHYFTTVTINAVPFQACLKCASLVVPGEQQRHWDALHNPLKRGLL